MLLCEMVQRDNVLAARRVPNDDDALAAEHVTDVRERVRELLRVSRYGACAPAVVRAREQDLRQGELPAGLAVHVGREQRDVVDGAQAVREAADPEHDPLAVPVVECRRCEMLKERQPRSVLVKSAVHLLFTRVVVVARGRL